MAKSEVVIESRKYVNTSSETVHFMVHVTLFYGGCVLLFS